MDSLIKVDRRTTLIWLGASVTGATLAGWVAVTNNRAGPARGYGADPDVLNPTVPWPKTMSRRQLELASVLGDLILPATATAPAPSAVGIADFIDEWVSAPYPDQQRDRDLILPGLLWLDTEAERHSGGSFTGVAPERQYEILIELSAPPRAGDEEATLRYGFFRRFRFVAVGAYFSLERNFAELGYAGNTALETFPPPTAQELDHINRAIAELGL